MSDANVMSSHSKTMANHLIACSLQPDSVKQQVNSHKEKYSDKTIRSPGRQRTVPSLQYHFADPLGPFSYTPPESFPAGPSTGSAHQNLISTTTLSYGTQLQPDHRLDSHATRYQPYPSEAIRHSTKPPSASSSFDSLHPSDSASQMSYQPPDSRPSSRPSSQLGRRRGSYMQQNIPGELMVPVWSPARTRLFEYRILCLMASAGFPLSWVENPEFQALREEFIPGSPYISRKVLTKRILREVVTEFRKEVKQRVIGKEATIQSDGWTGINNHHLIAFMMTTDKKVSELFCLCGVQRGTDDPAMAFYLGFHC